MKRFLVILVLITLFAVTFASLRRGSTVKKQVNKVEKKEKTCSFSCFGRAA